jgi:hypothetical protein
MIGPRWVTTRSHIKGRDQSLNNHRHDTVNGGYQGVTDCQRRARTEGQHKLATVTPRIPVENHYEQMKLFEYLPV